MALRIVSRNPIPSNCGDIRMERIVDDEFGTVYEVQRAGSSVAFEVTYGCRFSSWRWRPRAHHVGESA